MLNVAATCAAAGIIVGVVAKTGLGLKFSAIVIAYAGGSLPLTAFYTALIVWIIGLAVPVTASYIICAVIAAPALTKLGVPDFAAHMFIFYYAVLSEVSPPTALSPFAAAAITGGNPYKTTHAVVEVHAAGVRGALRLRARSRRRRAPAQGAAHGFVAARRVDHVHGDRRHCRARLRRAEVAFARVQRIRAVGAHRLRPAAHLSRRPGRTGSASPASWRCSAGSSSGGRARPPCRSNVRKVDELFARYGESHQHPANKAIHWICVPLITWSVLALSWSSSPIAAYVVIAFALAFYAWLCRPGWLAATSIGARRCD